MIDTQVEVLCIDPRGGMRTEASNIDALASTMITVPIMRKQGSTNTQSKETVFGDLLFLTTPDELMINELFWLARGEVTFVCTTQHGQGVDWCSHFSLSEVLFAINLHAQNFMLQRVIILMQHDSTREQRQLLDLAAWTREQVKRLSES